MNTLVLKELEQQIIIVTKKFKNITDKYSDNQPIGVKDLEDMRRYSEIALNLSQVGESLYKW